MWTFLLTLVCLGAAQPTDCDVQLQNYYVGLGLVGPPLEPALTLTPGVFLGTDYVTATMSFQTAARAYQLLLNATLVGDTWVSFVSLDIPWCTTRIALQCCSQVISGMAKTSNCTTLIDYDQGGNNYDSGRLYIYANQTAGCDGTPVVTFYNTTLQPSQPDDTYTFDAVGIRDHVLLGQTAAQVVYRSSFCNYTDGSPASMTYQNQFVCVAQRIGCVGNRTTNAPAAPAIPVPSYSCIGNVTPNGTQYTVWWVSSMQAPNTIDLSFGFTFTDSMLSAAYYEAIYGALGIDYTLISGTRRQFASPFTTLTAQFGLMNYNGLWWAYAPQYTFSNNLGIAVLPCMCDFNVDCVNGVVDLTSIASATVRLNNAIPVPYPGPNVQVNWLSPTFLLNASGSYDPDEAPRPLSVFWRVNATPYDPIPPPFVLDNPQAFEILINSSALQPGDYIFVLYASDGQAWPFVYYNVTILANVVTAMVENDKIVVFDFYSGIEPGHECPFYPPTPTITINASLSHGTNPSIPLYYSWEQMSGFPLTYLCNPFGFQATRGFFNTTSPIAEFVPASVGLYLFEVTVTDNISSSTARLQVQVNPDFDQPPSTFTPIINFTAPPILNLTPPTREEYNFTNVTIPPLPPQAPVDPDPPSNITPPPVIPFYPPATTSEIIGLVFVAGAMMIMLWAIVTAWWLYRHQTELRYYDSVVYGPADDYPLDNGAVVSGATGQIQQQQ